MLGGDIVYDSSDGESCYDPEDFSLERRQWRVLDRSLQRGLVLVEEEDDEGDEVLDGAMALTVNAALPRNSSQTKPSEKYSIHSSTAQPSCSTTSFRLKDWLIAGGGEAGSVIISTGVVRGVCASRSLRRGDLLIRVPRKTMLGFDALLSCELGPLYESNTGRAVFSCPTRALVALLLFEACKGTDSFWYSYIESLPRVEDFTCFVDRWSERHIACVNAPWLPTLVQGKRAEITTSWSALVVLLREVCNERDRGDNVVTQAIRDLLARLEERSNPSSGSPRGLEFYRWAFWCVESRAFLDRSSGAAALPVLIPFADMLNHQPHDWKCDTADFPDDGGFELRANRDLSAGQEVFNSYGRRTNRELLVSYGFTILNNPWDSVTMPVPWSDSQQQLQQMQPRPARFHTPGAVLECRKLDLLCRCDSETRRLFLGRVPCPTLIWALRVWTARSDAEFAHLREDNQSPMSAESEIRALKAYINALPTLPISMDELGNDEDASSIQAITQAYNQTLHNIVDKHLAYCELQMQRISS